MPTTPTKGKIWQGDPLPVYGTLMTQRDEYLTAAHPTTEATGNPTKGSEEEVQATSKFLAGASKLPPQH